MGAIDNWDAAIEQLRNDSIYNPMTRDDSVCCPVCFKTFDPDFMDEVRDVEGRLVCDVCALSEGFICENCGVFFPFDGDEGDGPICKSCKDGMDEIDLINME